MHLDDRGRILPTRKPARSLTRGAGFRGVARQPKPTPQETAAHLLDLIDDSRRRSRFTPSPALAAVQDRLPVRGLPPHPGYREGDLPFELRRLIDLALLAGHAASLAKRGGPLQREAESWARKLEQHHARFLERWGSTGAAGLHSDGPLPSPLPGPEDDSQTPGGKG